MGSRIQIRFQNTLILVLFTIADKTMKVTSVSLLSYPPPNFKELITQNLYVDKTLLIKSIFEEPEKILITAPRGFGKTTNLDMLKTFLEISVNASGQPEKVKKTINYKLFKNNNLTICKDKDLFNGNFGRYPVILLDYSPLNSITSFKAMLQSFRIIVKKTYSYHKYLLQNGDIFTNSELELFQICCDYANNTLTKTKIKKALNLLPEILFRKFKKEVFILIDEFDSYEYNLVLQNNSETDKIISYIQSINNDLLELNIYLDRSLLMGSLSVTGVSLSEHVHDIMDCGFARHHSFNKFNGITDKELDELLNKLIKEKNERDYIKSNIVQLYKGYTILKENTDLYNTRSVLGFLQNKVQVSEILYKSNYSLKTFLSIFSFQTIQDQVEYLLNDNTILLDITQTISKKEINSLKTMSKSGSTKKMFVDLFFYLLFELGYLSIKDGSRYKQKKIELKIPNLEIKLEYASLLRNVYNNKYNVLEIDIDTLNKIINQISAEQFNCILFENLLLALNVLFGHAKYQSKNEHGFQSILLVSFMKIFPFAKSIVHARKPRSIIYIVVKNHNGVTFIVAVKTTVSETKVYRKKVALEAHKQIIKNEFINSVDFSSRNKVVFLGISSSYKKNISIAYSYFFKEGDNLNRTILLTSNRKVE